MHPVSRPNLADIIGDFPYRITLAGGWIDQPFCSRLNPEPPGSICLASIVPDFYAVNEDGDKPEKAAFCRRHGIEYVVLRRIPKAGLAARSSTGLRGF